MCAWSGVQVLTAMEGIQRSEDDFVELGFSFYPYLGFRARTQVWWLVWHVPLFYSAVLFIYCFRIVHVCRQTPTCECRRGQIPCQWSYWCCELSDTVAGNWGWVLNKASTLLITSPPQPLSMPSNNTNILAICTHTPPATKAHWARLLYLSWLLLIPFLFHPSHLSPYDKVEAASKFPKLGITTQIYLMYFHSYYVVLLFVVQKDWRLLTLGIYISGPSWAFSNVN